MIAYRKMVLVVLVFFITACPHYTMVEPGKRNIGNSYRVQPQTAWSMSTLGKVEIWTVDGPTLEAVHFFKGIADGETLLPTIYGRHQSDPKAKRPQFRKDMNPNEVMEFVVDSMTTSGLRSPIGPNLKGVNIQTSYLRPFNFGSHPGYRFEFSYISDQGLEYKGLAAGTIKDDKLYLICYTGTKEYYYFKYRQQVEEIISSIDMP